ETSDTRSPDRNAAPATSALPRRTTKLSGRGVATRATKQSLRSRSAAAPGSAWGAEVNTNHLHNCDLRGPAAKLQPHPPHIAKSQPVGPRQHAQQASMSASRTCY